MAGAFEIFLNTCTIAPNAPPSKFFCRPLASLAARLDRRSPPGLVQVYEEGIDAVCVHVNNFELFIGEQDFFLQRPV